MWPGTAAKGPGSAAPPVTAALIHIVDKLTRGPTKESTHIFPTHHFHEPCPHPTAVSLGDGRIAEARRKIAGKGEEEGE